MNGALQPVLSYVKSMGWLGKTMTGIGLLILTEPAYELYKVLRQTVARRRTEKHICEVHFMNRRRVGNPVPSSKEKNLEHFYRVNSYIDRAEKSICLSMYLLTISEVTEAVLKAKQRGVTVRVIACESMAFNGKSQLRALIDGDIPVRYELNSSHIMHHKYCLLDTEWYCTKCIIKAHIAQYGEPSKNMQYTAFDKAILSDMEGLVKLFGTSCSRCDPKKVSSAPNQRRTNQNPLPSAGLLITGSCNWTSNAFLHNRENMMFTSLPELVEPFTLEFQRNWYEMRDLLETSQLPIPSPNADPPRKHD